MCCGRGCSVVNCGARMGIVFVVGGRGVCYGA